MLLYLEICQQSRPWECDNPEGISKECGKGEGRLLGFPCFPYSVISTARFGSAFHNVTITAKARFENRNHTS